MRKIVFLLPIVLSACMAAAPEMSEAFGPVEVSRNATWAGCEAEGGALQQTETGGLVCVAAP